MEKSELFKQSAFEINDGYGVTAIGLNSSFYKNMSTNIHSFNNFLQVNNITSKNIIIYPLEIETQ